ncbi:MAG: reverse transcriptase family protein [Clostridia bacterium]|jgi:retron-type reverse transcriptase|nr:reverse transcriptase family protein [Clostridia bacterium]
MYEIEMEKGIITLDEYKLINNYIERLIENSIPVIFDLRHLRKILKIPKNEQKLYFDEKEEKRYRSFKIPKKSGGYRLIEAPVDGLKLRQRWIKNEIIDKFKISEHAKGYKKHTSIYNNALPHVNKELVVNIDIENFFPTIRYESIYKFFVYVGYNKQVAHLLTKMCTNSKKHLPQGAPTSPSLSNILLLKLDKRLSELAKKANAQYTRYVDDITFSGSKNIKTFVPTIINIIEDEGYEINKKKLRLQYSNQRQVVTGLTVNKKVSVSKKKIKEIENAIYYSKKFGIVEHMKKIDCQKSFYKEHLYGIAYFIKMIDKEKGENYLKGLDEVDWIY